MTSVHSLVQRQDQEALPESSELALANDHTSDCFRRTAVHTMVKAATLRGERLASAAADECIQ
jgi:hypothetical protein